MATGYLQAFPFLESKQNSGRKAYPRADQADVREVWKRDDPTVGFIGFIRPGFGAIPPLSELQVMLWIMNLLGQVKKPLVEDDQWHYRLIAPPEARLSYGVEHDSYAYQLAADMDAAAGFTDVALLSFKESNGRYWRLPWIWAASTNFTVKFRLVGPWAWKGAADVMTDDLWEVISRRQGLFGKWCPILADFEIHEKVLTVGQATSPCSSCRPCSLGPSTCFTGCMPCSSTSSRSSGWRSH